MERLEIDLEKVKRDLERIYRDLDRKTITQATYRALNHTTAKAVKPTDQYIRTKLRLKSAQVKAQIKRGYARPGKLYTSLGARTKPMRVKDFPHGQRRKGVSVSISPGKRKMIKRAFVQTMPNGHVGVFARGEYKPGGFQFSKAGSPGPRMKSNRKKQRITQLHTTSVAQKLDDPALLTILRRKTYTDFPVRLGYLLGRASSFGPSSARI